MASQFYPSNLKFTEMIERVRQSRLAVLVCLAVAFSGAANAQDKKSTPGEQELAANPGRPTVSTPATLTPVGYLQFETGILGAAEHSGGFSNRVALEETIKFAIAKRFQFLVVAEPVVTSDQNGPQTNGPGGVSLGGQLVLLPGEGLRPTVSVSYFRSVYGGTAPDLDVGSSRNSLLLLFSFDFGKLHVDTNYIFNEQIENAVHRAQFGQTLSLSHPLRGNFGFTGELWHFTQPFQEGNAAGLLLAPTYTVNSKLVLDLGFNRGFTSTSTTWEVFAGFTYLLPKKLLP